MMLAFDVPNPATTVGRRNVSNVPAQALILLNDPFVDEQALFWARGELKTERPPDERIKLLYEAALGRPPDEPELAAALEFLHAQADELHRPAAWQSDERGLGRPGSHAVEFERVFVCEVTAEGRRPESIVRSPEEMRGATSVVAVFLRK